MVAPIKRMFSRKHVWRKNWVNQSRVLISTAFILEVSKGVWGSWTLFLSRFDHVLNELFGMLGVKHLGYLVGSRNQVSVIDRFEFIKRLPQRGVRKF